MANSNITSITPERSEAELLEAMQKLTLTSIDVIGVDNTFESFEFFTGIINNYPDTYQKLFKPENRKKFTDLFEKYSGKNKPGVMDMMTIVGAISDILK